MITLQKKITSLIMLMVVFTSCQSPQQVLSKQDCINILPLSLFIIVSIISFDIARSLAMEVMNNKPMKMMMKDNPEMKQYMMSSMMETAKTDTTMMSGMCKAMMKDPKMMEMMDKMKQEKGKMMKHMKW